jgi:acyl-CoA synthetase (AMP-forming)/AMP-acid ligase II
VEEGAAYALPDREGSFTIEAAVIVRSRPARSGSTPGEADLKAHLAGLLPAYALPGKVLILAEFPRTTSGKIDRRALRERALAVPEATP